VDSIPITLDYGNYGPGPSTHPSNFRAEGIGEQAMLAGISWALLLGWPYPPD
jgi:hypothetical protein